MVTSVDLFFSAKDTDLPVFVEIRNVIGGRPGPKVLPFSRTVVLPANVNTSTDGKTATKVTFSAPVFLQSGQEYCIAVYSTSPKYLLWISDLGTEDADGNLVSEQPQVGTLFKHSFLLETYLIYLG